MSDRAAMVFTLASGLLFAQPAHADVNVGINIGTPAPPPPLAVTTPPPLVVVPGSSVYYAPGVSFNLFVYAGRYYSFHNGTWFVATSHSGPWTVVMTERVPKPVLAVPVAYYKIPPGHAKKMAGPPAGRPGHGKSGKGKHGWDD